MHSGIEISPRGAARKNAWYEPHRVGPVGDAGSEGTLGGMDQRVDG